MRLLKTKDSLTKALLEYRDKLFSGIFLNNVLVASLNGVVSNDGKAIITRLSVNKEYGVYCPGGLLINETIKTLCNGKNTIKSLDLSRGGEQYKYDYGGVEHYNYTYIIK